MKMLAVTLVIIVAVLKNATIKYESESLCVSSNLNTLWHMKIARTGWALSEHSPGHSGTFLHILQYKLSGPATQLWYKLGSHIKCVCSANKKYTKFINIIIMLSYYHVYHKIIIFEFYKFFKGV